MEQSINIIKYIFLGLFQGFTEPIPVSSSGHLVLLQHFFGIKIEGMSFELLVNAASLIAVLLIYSKEIIALIQNSLKYIATREKQYLSDFKFAIYLIIATIPVAIGGILFEDAIESVVKSSAKVVGVTLIVTGIALWLIRNLKGRKKDGDLTLKDAIIIGLAQMVALIPGISRSGATIVAAMGLGLKQELALRFSFLLFIPVSLGGFILSISTLSKDPHINTLMLPYLCAFIASLIASYFSLKWFMNVMAKGNLKYFAYYCFVAGILAILMG
ncbi:undecaprenyl-diphosphate phosphatase [Macrococcoides caseolyticum]|uniref:undecaprenyl-diphosphate phosphatase n=1 Tax=Macrococcoides caseolyticum TaxID=69966 RepID=UPI001F2F6DA8|nr:undecaprenyl-diphosphate phosphatase [Macrococcus caseolyticus]MCE4956435.1 undecaprenyl-diphosphate phosphatase [Macrococcus caseolyticus]